MQTHGQCMQFIQNILNFETYACSHLIPGQAVGSKEPVGMVCVPGTCNSTGGAPVGTVEKNDRR